MQDDAGAPTLKPFWPRKFIKSSGVLVTDMQDGKLNFHILHYHYLYVFSQILPVYYLRYCIEDSFRKCIVIMQGTHQNDAKGPNAMQCVYIYIYWCSWVQKHVTWWEVHKFWLTLLDLLASFRRTTSSNQTINCDWSSMTCLRRRRPEICWMLVGIVMSYIELDVKMSDDVRCTQCTHVPQDQLCKFFSEEMTGYCKWLKYIELVPLVFF